ncbi:MAG: FRG domain-containing protein, partial [Coprobacillus sp.]
MKKYKIDSISKYLSIIEKNGISNYIYRGQNEPYYSIEASGFRPYLGGWSSDKIYDMEHLHQAFQNRVIGQLSEDEKRHFLAFCQHHGIPTNLVDVSYSPLVALFFACDGKVDMKFSLEELISNKSIDELERDKSLQEMLIHNLINQARKPFHSFFAQTYLIKRERIIDISNLIAKLNGKSLFEELLLNKKIAHELLELIDKEFVSIDKTTLKDWLKNLIKTYIDISEVDGATMWSDNLYKDIKALFDECEIFNDIFYQKLYKILSSWEESILFSNQFEEFNIMFSLNQTSIATMYTLLLIEVLNSLKNFPRKVNIDLDIYFTYQPPELFERISSQQ